MNFNKITKLVDKLIYEGIAEIKKYFPNIEEDMIRKLIALDPTYRGNENLGNYGRWILSIYNKGNLKEEDFYKVTDYLNTFEENKKKFTNKDIFQFKSLPDLYNAIQQISGEDTELSARQQQRELKKQGMKDAKLLFEDEKWQVWTPTSYEASCKLGAGTAWCTASGKHSGYYDDYTRNGTLYIMINKEDPEDKYQFHFETSSFMDSDDRSIELMDFLDYNPSLKMFYANLTKEKPEILEHAPQLFFLIEEHTDEEIYKFVQGVDSNLQYDPETKKIAYKENIPSFIESTVTESGRGDYVSPDSATEILTGESNIFYDIDIDDSSIGHALKYLKSERYANIDEYLYKIDLSLKDIINYFDERRDDDILEELKEKSGFDDIEEMLDEISSSARNAKTSGTESEAYNGIMSAIKDDFPDIVREDDNFIFHFTLDDIKDTIDYFGSYEDMEYDGFLTSYVKSRNKGDMIRISEPYYGFDGFDEEYFADETLSAVKYSITNFIRKEDEE